MKRKKTEIETTNKVDKNLIIDWLSDKRQVHRKHNLNKTAINKN